MLLLEYHLRISTPDTHAGEGQRKVAEASNDANTSTDCIALATPLIFSKYSTIDVPSSSCHNSTPSLGRWSLSNEQDNNCYYMQTKTQVILNN